MELNADLGESWYDKQVGNDSALMPYLDACNIACGFHGGDALTLQRTIDLAIEYGVVIGAHPSFPDRKQFGRCPMKLESERLRAILLYQVAAIQGMVKAAGGRLHHVKPHGALYHFANHDAEAAGLITEVMIALNIPILYGPPAGELRKSASAAGLLYYAEAFVDRRYEADLRLRSRQFPDAVIDTTEESIIQVTEMLHHGQVRTIDGKLHPIDADTLCLHGDQDGAVSKAVAIRKLLDATPLRE